MTPQVTHQEMADYLAEHLLGWSLARPEPFIADIWTKDSRPIESQLLMKPDTWQPQNNIAQCFEYILPAMTKRKTHLSLKNDNLNWDAVFWNDDKMGIDNQATPAAAIVKAAYAVVKETP